MAKSRRYKKAGGGGGGGVAPFFFLFLLRLHLTIESFTLPQEPPKRIQPEKPETQTTQDTLPRPLFKHDVHQENTSLWRKISNLSMFHPHSNLPRTPERPFHSHRGLRKFNPRRHRRSDTLDTDSGQRT